MPDVASIDIQTEIKWFMRPYLMDFLIEAHQAFGLSADTLFLSINLLDRYCSKRIVYKKHYQLVGCAALLIASKYGDRKDLVPTIKELRNMCCSLYEDDMFLQMEWHVLQTLNWVIGHPTIDSFLQIATDRQPSDPEVEHMACYISEIALFQREFVAKRPSDMARSALALARCILGRGQELVTVWAGQFDPILLKALYEQTSNPSKILYRKYSSAALSRVALVLDDHVVQSQEKARLEHEAALKQEASKRFAQATTNCGPATPHKEHPQPTFNNGCLTPPDTPTENDNFPSHSHQRTIIEPTRPPTPPDFGYPYSVNQMRLPPLQPLTAAVG